MVISYQSNDTVSIKAKNEVITVGVDEGIQIVGYPIHSAGEFDIAGIQCESSYLEKAVVYFVRTEELTVTFLSDVDTNVTKLDDASKTDILIIDVRSDSDVADLKSILKGVEPAYLVLIGSGYTPELAAQLSLPVVEGPTLKVTRASLPLEGTHLLAR